jgi:N-acetyl-anhydromuramyl-L-alanine amidase AmpD
MQVIRSKWYGEGRGGVNIRLVVIHDMEAPERSTTAENVARYFANLPASNKASAHVCVDDNSAVRCVDDGDRAWHAPGANSDGLGLELAGYARQSRAEWLDTYSKAVLGQAATVTASWCRKYAIPVRRLTISEIKAGKKGIVGHRDISAAYRQTDHTDPGPNFPWDVFLGMVRDRMGTSSGGGTHTSKRPAYPKGIGPNKSSPSAKTLQTMLKATGWMNKSVPLADNYGPITQNAVAGFNRKHGFNDKGLNYDPAIGPRGWELLCDFVYG